MEVGAGGVVNLSLCCAYFVGMDKAIKDEAAAYPNVSVISTDAKGDVVEFDIDPRLIEQFGKEAAKVIRGLMDQGQQFVLVAAPDARPYVRMVMERLFATLPVLSHVEIARGVEIKSLGTIS